MCEQSCMDKREVTRCTTFGTSSENGIWKQLARNILSSKHCPTKFSSQSYVKTVGLNEHRVSAGMMYKTRLDEDDGYGQLVPFCPGYTHSRANPQSQVFAAIPGRTVIGAVTEVQIVKILDQERLDLRMKFTTTKSNSDPAQNYSLHLSNQKGKNLAWKNPVIATRKLVLTMSQVDMATRKLVQTILAVFQDCHFYEREEVGGYSCQSIARRSSCRYRSPKWFKDGTSWR